MASDSANTPDVEVRTSTRSWLRIVVLGFCGTVILTVGSLVTLMTAVVTLFQSRRFCAEVLVRAMGRMALGLSGVRMVVHREFPLPAVQTIYISNHTATLDVFATVALGLPNTRYFLSGFLRKILPLGLIGYLIGVFWTVPFHFPEKRRKIFQRADRVLRRSGESVYLTPEGGRIRTGKIGHFNRGAFHLATSLRANIVPIYIRIPEEIDSGMHLVSGTGRVDVYFLPPISTADWTLTELDQNRDAARQLYVDFHAKLGSSQ